MRTGTYFLALISLFFSTAIQAQVDSTLASYYRTNFAAPNHPAFTVLGSQSSEILRPTDVKEFSVIAANFFAGGSAVLPKAYSVEIAPYLLARANNLKLGELNETGQRILSTVRLSIGTSLGESGSVNKAAAGLRFSLINKGDLRFDQAYLENFLVLLQSRQALDNKFTREEGPPCPPTDIACNNERNRRIASKVDSVERIVGKGSLNQRITKLREHYKALYWNKTKLDFALAISGNSSDSLVRNIRFNQFTVWGTYAFPVKNWGQWLVGATYTSRNRDSLLISQEELLDLKYRQLTLSSRLYAGVNRLKGFVEYQAKFGRNDPSQKVAFFSALWNVGGEVNVVDGLWLNFSAGLLFSDYTLPSRSSFVSSFNIRFALPENFRL